MLTIVVALAFSMEQADLGVVQSLYGTNECMRTCPHCIDTVTCTEGIIMMTARSGAHVQGPLRGVSAALLSRLVCSQPCVESPRWVLVADTLKRVSDCCIPDNGQSDCRALMVRSSSGRTNRTGASCIMQAGPHPGQLRVSH